LAQAECGGRNKLTQPEIEKLILEEFGRCLRQIIDTANNSRLYASFLICLTVCFSNTFDATQCYIVDKLTFKRYNIK